MTAKAEKAPSPDVILYDSTKPQAIPLNLEKNGQKFRVVHNLNPLSNERFIEYLDDFNALAKKLKKVTTAVVDPHKRLWSDLVISREGYKERDDWKEKTHPSDQVAVTAALLHVRVLDNAEVEVEKESAVYDDDELTVIEFRAMCAGALLTLSHSFREETKAEYDQYLAIDSEQPDENSISSADRKTKVERMYLLGKKLITETSGYAEGEIPAWHIAATTEAFFARQSARMGKFLEP